MYLAGCLLAIAFGIPMYLMANTGEPFLIVLLFIIGIGVIHAVLTGTQGAWFAELFKTNTRTSGASIGYQVAASIAGFAPFLAVLLANSLGLDRACPVLRGRRPRRSGRGARHRRPGVRNSAPRWTP